jgi:hypothetical protein
MDGAGHSALKRRIIMQLGWRIDRHEFEASLKALTFDPGVEVDLPPNTVRAGIRH